MKAQAPPAAVSPAPTIPLVDLAAQYEAHREEIDAAIAQAVQSRAFIGGPLTARFEGEFARAMGMARAVGCSSGTSAIRLALAGLDIGRGAEVVVPALTFIATAEPVVHAGAEVVFADVDPRTCCLDPEAAEAAATPRTRAVIGVDLHGRLADWGRLAPLGAKPGLELLRDAAQSHAARPATEAQGAEIARERGIGALARAATYSFYPGKNLGAYGDAGALATDDAGLADFAKRFADHGREGKYEHREIGDNCRMDGIQAAILSVKLRWLPGWNAARRRLAENYVRLLEGVGDLRLPGLDAAEGHAWHLFAIRTARRDALLAHLKAEGIGAGVHYPIPLHLQPAFAGHPQAKAGAFPNAEAIARETISLPLYPEMTESQLERSAGSVRRFFEGSG